MTAWMVLTDLDGTLLDHDSYDWHPAEPALQALQTRGIPVIAVTSKTPAELASLRLEIPYLAPLMACENGAVVIDDRAGLQTREVLGEATDTLIDWFEHACRETGARCIGFHQASDQQVAEWTGLTLADAGLARDREASLPVYYPAQWPNRTAFIEAVEAQGGRVLEGGRFLHLAGHADKGTALKWMIDRLHIERTVALGDGGNDDAMLALATIAIRIPTAGTDRPESLTSIQRASQPGPAGWNEAMLSLMGQGLFDGTRGERNE
ncbi:HAD-IIB family hydrolase [Saccharospirillum impatiens]|uniref:HAD-IIB family hydrolase n=1 Tax=Saccharospirillum impatiens TaxID=169438 RepID=UPI00040FC04A|nr:HAD-IIB family hydrolase [Saccharospirillum impatiens]